MSEIFFKDPSAWVQNIITFGRSLGNFDLIFKLNLFMEQIMKGEKIRYVCETVKDDQLIKTIITDNSTVLRYYESSADLSYIKITVEIIKYKVPDFTKFNGEFNNSQTSINNTNHLDIIGIDGFINLIRFLKSDDKGFIRQMLDLNSNQRDVDEDIVKRESQCKYFVDNILPKLKAYSIKSMDQLTEIDYELTECELMFNQ